MKPEDVTEDTYYLSKPYSISLGVGEYCVIKIIKIEKSISRIVQYSIYNMKGNLVISDKFWYLEILSSYLIKKVKPKRT